jgi:hypothetical protein
VPGTHWIGDWAGLEVGLDAVENTNSLLYLDWNAGSSVVQPLANSYTKCAIPLGLNILVLSVEVKLCACILWFCYKMSLTRLANDLLGRYINTVRNKGACAVEPRERTGV